MGIISPQCIGWFHALELQKEAITGDKVWLFMQTTKTIRDLKR